MPAFSWGAILPGQTAPEPSPPGAALLVAQLRERIAAKQNVVFSPASLRSALGMAALAARGRTAEELRALLDLPPDADIAAVAAAERAALEAARAASDGELVAADSVWWFGGDAPRADYLAALREGFGAEAFPLPSRDPAPINRWISEMTRGRIPAAVGPLPDAPDRAARLVLADALYFKMKWQCAFDRKQTRTDSFFTEDGAERRVRFMSLVGFFPAFENETYRSLRLPYRGGRFDMQIVVPRGERTLADVLEAWHRGETVPGAEPFVGEVHADVRLPRFDLHDTHDVSRDLRALGAATAFGPGADFSGAFPREGGPLWLDAVRQEAFVEVDEEGTTAAAATYAVGIGCAATPMPWPFHVDRPFLFLLRCTDDGRILFAGAVFDAAAAQTK